MSNKLFEEVRLAVIEPSEIEDKITKQYGLEEINKEEERIWEEICKLKSTGRSLEKLTGYEEKLKKIENDIISRIRYLSVLNNRYLEKMGNTGLQCSRLTRRRAGQSSIMFQNPDGGLSWMSV